MSKIKLLILIALGATGYVVWAFMAWQDASLRADFLKMNEGVVLGIVGLALRDMPPPSPPGAPGSQTTPAP